MARLLEGVRVFVCGTRATICLSSTVADYRVVCATCGAGGTIQYLTNAKANAAAVRDSNKPCRTCGAS